MIWVILVITIVVCFSTWKSFRARCPNCGRIAIHKKDEQADKKIAEKYESYRAVGGQRMVDLLDASAVSHGGQTLQPGYINRNFICSKCGCRFNRFFSKEYLKMSNRYGNRRAIDQYKEDSEKRVDER